VETGENIARTFRGPHVHVPSGATSLRGLQGEPALQQVHQTCCNIRALPGDTAAKGASFLPPKFMKKATEA